MELLTPPSKPYMIVLGTSHTNGDCEGSGVYLELESYNSSGKEHGPEVVHKTAYMALAEKLQLKIVNIGLSGSRNIDMLNATNELAYHGFLNENCKLFILEPRLIDNTYRVPINVLHDKFYVNAPEKTRQDWILNHDNKNRGILCGYGARRGYSGSDKVDASWTQQVSWDTHLHQESFIDANDKRQFVKNDKLLSAFRDSHTYVSNTPYQFVEQLTLIDSIKNIVKAHNISFAWQLMLGMENDIKICKKLLENNSDLFDYFINIVDDFEIGPELKCKCGHLNDAGHIYWYNKTWERVEEIMKISH